MDTASWPLPTCCSLVFCLLLLLTASAGTTKAAGGAELTADTSVEFAPCRPGEGGCSGRRDGPSHPFLYSQKRIQTSSVTEAPDTLPRPCTRDEADRMACKSSDVCRRLKDGRLSCVHKRVKRKKKRDDQLPCTPEEEQEVACINGYCYALDLGDFRYPLCKPWGNVKVTTRKPLSHRAFCTRREKRQTACINGYCYALIMGNMRRPSCRCTDPRWEGNRCEVLSLDYYLRYRAELKKTAIISCVVIGLIIIVVSISVYCSYKRGKKKRAAAAEANKVSEEAAGVSEPAKAEPEAEPMVPNGNADSSV